ncbi:MAG: hypothetical protein ICV60_00185 [Pyrinomonadaceae bacterium]|nr:hypothetical protein [Pyrinomonadaceae bacterium]
MIKILLIIFGSFDLESVGVLEDNHFDCPSGTGQSTAWALGQRARSACL